MSAADARRVLLVLGMHRSGTSALARVLSLHGADLPAHLMEPNPGNETGYWEPAPIVAFNDELLDYFGTSWDDPFAAFQLPDSALFPRRFVQHARSLLAQEYGDSRLFVLKDPRHCLLAGFWSQLLAGEGVQVCPVLLARPCGEVAASLQARDQVPAEATALLYVAYAVEAALQLVQAPTVVRYDQLLADWRGTADRIAAEQGLQWPRTGASLDAEVSGFLHRADARETRLHPSPRVQEWIDGVWNWYVAGSEGRRLDVAPLRAIREQMADAAASFAPLLGARRQRLRVMEQAQAKARGVANEREALLRQTAAERDELMAQRDKLLELHDRQVADGQSQAQAIAGLKAERDGLRADAGRLRADAAERHQAFADLLVERDQLLGRFQAAQASAAEAGPLREERDKLLELYRRTQAELERARMAFDTASTEIDALIGERDRALVAFDGTNATLHATEQAFQRLSGQAEELRAQREAQLQVLAQFEARIESSLAEASALRDLITVTRANEQALRAEAAALAQDRDTLRHQRDDQAALAGQRELDLAQLREVLDRNETSRTALVAEAQRTQRELESLRSELRRAQDGLAQVHASRSWRITAPLRSVVSAGRHILTVSRTSLHRPRRLLQLAPPERREPLPPPAVATTPGEPAFTRRKHPGLRAFLAAEFGEGPASDVLHRIDRYRLPVDTSDGRGAASVACSEDEALSWARAIARRAAQRPDDPAAPDVSIIVPVYNQLPFTLACLEALLAHETRYRFEVLIGDDASTDATPRAFADPIAGVHYLRHPGNLGFVRNCNETAKLARGRVVVMLNNDTLVLPGWLDELVGVLDSNPSVGLVGSKLIYPDGRLQECGGIVWRDGSAWNFGRLDDPRRPEHNYLRGADFVSGASIALPAATWRKLGGFDELFVPAYAEDVDLAFRVRAAGQYTLVQPLSQVLHFEGVSAGTDLGQGMKAHQVGNLKKLHQRWERKLGFHRENGQYPELEKERDSSRRLLFIDHCTLTPNEDAGSLVAFEMLTSFRRHGYKVTFIPEDNFAHMGEDTRVLQRLGVEAIYHPAYSRMEQFLAARNDPFDVIVMHRFTVGDRHMAALRERYPAARFVFLACDLHYLREQREAELSGDAAAAQRALRTKQRELAVVGASDAVVVYSDAEQAIVQAELPQARVSLFPLVHDPVASPMPLEHREGVCFVGGYRHAPNADAIRWFVDQVWPLVYARCPQAILHVAGSHMTDAVKALGSRPGVAIAGFIPDLEAFLSRRRVNIAPLRFGAGVKGKVAASLANGLPTVGTHIAAEGMQLTPGADILVADDPAGFAAHVVELLTDDARWREVSEAGLRYAATVTSRASAHQRIGTLLDELGLPALA